MEGLGMPVMRQIRIMPASVTTEDKVEELKQQSDIQKALEQTAVPKELISVPAKRKQKLFLGTYFTFLLLFTGFYYLLRLGLFYVANPYRPFVQRVLVGSMAIVITLGLARTLDVYFISRVQDSVSKYNIRRIVKLLAALLVALIVITVLFANWYTAMVSLGLGSLILGFALQTPITSFFAWIYILVRAPYRVGDRIKIGDATGDVIDVSYLDTTLWEFGGDFLSTDHPSGRVIKFPNSKILSSTVYNYTWPLFPYVWNEIKFSVAYESDLEFIAETMQRGAEEEVGERMMKQVTVFRELLAQTPVDELQVRAHPAVIFRVNVNTWLDAIVRYLVHPKEAGRVKTRLIRKLLGELNAAPDKVMFPRSNAR